MKGGTEINRKVLIKWIDKIKIKEEVLRRVDEKVFRINRFRANTYSYTDIFIICRYRYRYLIKIVVKDMSIYTFIYSSLRLCRFDSFWPTRLTIETCRSVKIKYSWKYFRQLHFDLRNMQSEWCFCLL